VVIIGVYLWVIFGNGCRFGVQYLLSAIAIATIFFFFVAFNEPFWVQHKYVALGVGITQLIVPVYFAILLRRLNATKHKLKLLSFYDELTGVMNRRAFDDRLETEYSRLQRFPSSFSLALVDIDHFKKVNDTYGHLSGDIVLQKIAGTIRDTIRDVDIVALYGGEEFVLLIPGHISNEKGSGFPRHVFQNKRFSLTH
jgi:GGDEF domain-containing protein